MALWIRIPGPGEYRGEGEWVEVGERDGPTLEDWEWNQRTGYLPTYEGDYPPEDTAPEKAE